VFQGELIDMINDIAHDFQQWIYQQYSIEKRQDFKIYWQQQALLLGNNNTQQHHLYAGIAPIGSHSYSLASSSTSPLRSAMNNNNNNNNLNVRTPSKPTIRSTSFNNNNYQISTEAFSPTISHPALPSTTTPTNYTTNNLTDYEVKACLSQHLYLYDKHPGLWTLSPDYGITQYQPRLVETIKYILCSNLFLTVTETILPLIVVEIVDSISYYIGSFFNDLFSFDREEFLMPSSSSSSFSSSSSSSSVTSAAHPNSSGGAMTSVNLSNTSNSYILHMKMKLLALIPDVKEQVNDESNASNSNIFSNELSNYYTNDLPWRNYETGKLNTQGKALVASGQWRMRNIDIDAHLAVGTSSYTDDVLDLPICSYECYPLCYLCIWVSKSLNRFFHLPKHRMYLKCSWMKILRLDNKHTIKDLLYYNFRFNLRFLSSYRIGGILCIYMTQRLVQAQYLSVYYAFYWYLLFIVMILLGAFPTYIIS
jgi:hypothetical protein